MTGTAAAPPAPVAPAPGAAPVVLSVAADRDAVTIGDPITLTVTLVRPAQTRIDRFEPESALQSVGLLRSGDVRTRILPDGRVEEVRTLTFASYEVGSGTIPPIEVAFTDASGRGGTEHSAPVPFTVASVLAEGETEPADIKAPVTMPEVPLWPWVALALALAAFAAWAVWRRRRRRPAEAAAAAPAGPPRPAHEVAYAELQRLLASALLERGRVKEFHIELAEIIRRYLAARYGIETVERTSAEILEALRAARLPVKTTAALAEFFAACDMVKFARHLPAAEETRGTVERAYRLVDETRPADLPAPAGSPAPAVAQGGAR